MARFRFFWSESYGQIYPQLKKLASEGYIKAARDGDSRGSVRYTLTAKGKRAFDAWLEDPETQDQLRMESVLKIYMGAASGFAACGKAIRAFGEKSAAARDDLERMSAELAAGPDPYGNHAKIGQMLDLGIRTYRAWAEWASETDLGEEAL